jgi:hypothetical protein
MAEQSNLIREIGLWSIRRALDDRIELGLTRYPDVAVSVNVSARQLAEDGFLGTLNGLLAERNLPPNLLRLELTESAFIESPEKTIALISDLRRIGVRVIIDNFGTGYASLSSLKNLPVDGAEDRSRIHPGSACRPWQRRDRPGGHHAGGQARPAGDGRRRRDDGGDEGAAQLRLRPDAGHADLRAAAVCPAAGVPRVASGTAADAPGPRTPPRSLDRDDDARAGRRAGCGADQL